EVLDERDQPVRPGERGELVFTSLYRKAMPLIRYRTRDVVQLADRPCPCGRTLVAFEGGVLARLDDMKKIRGVIVYPRRVEELVRPHSGVDEFQIVFRRHAGLDDVLVRIDPSPSLSRAECLGLTARLADDLRTGLGIRVTVETVGAGVKGLGRGRRVIIFPGFACGGCEYCVRGERTVCVKYGYLGAHKDGGYAELVRAPAANILPLPEAIAFEAGAALPLAMLTAWHALVARAGLGPGQTVLVQAAGSGVGSAAIQIAR